MAESMALVKPLQTCTIPESNDNTPTLAVALCKAMNDNYPISGPPLNTFVSSLTDNFLFHQDI